MEDPRKNLVDIETLLKTVVFNKASDLHLVSRSAPQIRIDGTLRPLAMDSLSGSDIEYICYAMITDAQKSQLEENKELDSLEAVIRMFVYENRGKERFRIFKSTIRELLYES